MFGVELRVASVLRASKPEGEAPTGEGEEPASVGISASLRRGTELGVSENTSRSSSSSEMDSYASSSLGT